MQCTVCWACYTVHTWPAISQHCSCASSYCLLIYLYNMLIHVLILSLQVLPYGADQWFMFGKALVIFSMKILPFFSLSGLCLLKSNRTEKPGAQEILPSGSVSSARVWLSNIKTNQYSHLAVCQSSNSTFSVRLKVCYLFIS